MNHVSYISKQLVPQNCTSSTKIPIKLLQFLSVSLIGISFIVVQSQQQVTLLLGRL